jgi:transcriptional regulator with XRE-family HTH domain
MKSAIKLIREQLGLSQQELADYFNMPKGAFSMIETNKRPIPTALLAELTQLFTTPTSTSDFISDEWTMLEQAEMAKELATYAKELEWKMLMAKRELARLQAKHSLCIAKFQAFKKMRLVNDNAANTTAPMVAHKKAWLQQAELQTWKIYNTCSKADLAILEIKIESLENQLMACHTWLKSVEQKIF